MPSFPGTLKWTYLGKSKVLQYFGNVRFKSAAQDSFIKMTSRTGLYDAKLSWYSQINLLVGVKILQYRVEW